MHGPSRSLHLAVALAVAAFHASALAINRTLPGYQLNPRTTQIGTGASAGTYLTSKVQMFLLGHQYTF